MTHLNTGTAADLMVYDAYVDAHGHDRLQRAATASQQWIVQDWDGERYVVKFANNFSKKHLYTMSKREDEVREAAYFAWKNSGETGEAGDHWESGEHARMENKIELASRSRIKANHDTNCSYCGHSGAAANANSGHTGYNAATKTGGACNVPGCGCTAFYRYESVRGDLGKSILNPLAGAESKRNTCVILNWVPKAEFERVVCQSIQAAEKPAGWARGDALAKGVGDSFEVRWDFGPTRMGAVVTVDLRSTAVQLFTQHQGIRVDMRKTFSEIGTQVYEVYHYKGVI